MNIKKLEELKEKIETAKSDRAKAEGAKEQIEKTWKDDFDCSSVEEVKDKVRETEEQIKALSGKLEEYMKKIEIAMEEV
jgi:DNA repair exonuclease SbcCD ATPase subunit